MNKIIFPLKKDMSGEAVADLQDGLRLLIDKDVIKLTDAERQMYHEALGGERTESVYGEATHKLVKLFQQQQQLDPSGEVDEQTAGRLNQLGATASDKDDLMFSVKGKIFSRTRAGVGGLRVVIVDKNVGEDRVLADVATDDNGSFHVTFSIAELQQQGKKQPDLQARAFSGETFIGKSEVRYNASNKETLNIILQEEASKALPTEYETLTDTLAKHFKGELRNLKETDDQQDITYLANKTGWDARAVALSALADQFSEQMRSNEGEPIPPALFYALFRAGVPANENAIYQTDLESVATIWKQSIAQGIIPALLEASIPQALERFKHLVSDLLAEYASIGGVSSLKDMLSVSLGDDPARQKKYSDLHIEHRSDAKAFWHAVSAELGDTTAARLKLDGKLGYLTLNNAPLIRRLHEAAGQDGLTDPLDLVEQGLYRDGQWRKMISDVGIPPEIPGEIDDEKRDHYAEMLAAQVRLSYPTAVVADMVKNGETPVGEGMKEHIHAFLSEQQGKFEIGLQPIEQYIVRNHLDVDPEVIAEVTRVQRVRQITPSDDVMNALLGKGLDSAYAIVRYDSNEFVQTFKEEFGGEVDARLTYAKAQQVHNAVLNIATSYLIASTAPGVGAHSRPRILDPTPRGTDYASADVIAYPTLEGLFGEMDFCECEHCRSILSPAAYLVDLLHFLCPDNDVWTAFLTKWPSEHEGARYPFANMEEQNNFEVDWTTRFPGRDLPELDKTPFEVLSERRPDLKHLPLTCENTNTPLPYIDLVNEIVEYFIVADPTSAPPKPPLTLGDYKGHSTGGSVTSDELLANPQHVRHEAYEVLKNAHFPPPLPFHQPLENLRRFFDRFEASLPEVMEALRKDDDLERADPDDYGWRDILMEELRLARAEYRLLTDRRLTLSQLYDYAIGVSVDAVRDDLSNVKTFARRVGITYEDIIQILRTRFVNPNSTLIHKLERLEVPFLTLKALKDGAITDAEFDALLPAGLDASQYGDDVKAWVRDEANYANIMSLITVTNPTDEEDLCSFDTLEFRYANPDTSDNRLRPFEFFRLIRFIRLWKKLGWTVEQTDKAITALYPADQIPNRPNDAANLRRLDRGFRALIPRLGVVKGVLNALKLIPNKDLLALLACFAPIDTHGAASLYRQMFLRPAPAQQDPAFSDDGYGNFLANRRQRLKAHGETLRAAFLLTDNELGQITAALGFDENTRLNIGNISAVFRRGWLARKLELSVRELILLMQFTGIDPFAAPDPPHSPIVRFIDVVSRLRSASLKATQALYLVWNNDISGRSTPEDSEILRFVRSVRAGLAAIETEFLVADDPDGGIARARMGLVYGNDATDFFFGLLGNTLVTDVPYSHNQSSLKQPILDTAPGRVSYDDFRKRLSFFGILNTTTRDALKAVTGVTAEFQAAVDILYEENQKLIGPFFARYPELLALYNAYATSTESAEKKRSDLLANILPELKRRRKRQHALQAISAAAKTDVKFAGALLDDPVVLHAVGNDTRPALDDLTAAETVGLSAEFFFRDTATGSVDLRSEAEPNLAYSATGEKPLPANPTPGDAISGIWNGFLETPEDGFYNFYIEVDSGATVSLSLNGVPLILTMADSVWRNDEPIELRAGALNAFSLQVERVSDTLNVRWETMGRGRETIAAQYLYSATVTAHLRDVYTRFLKVASLAVALKLAAKEIVRLATHADYHIDGQGWLNRLPVAGSPDEATSTALLKAFYALLDFARIKAALAPDGERLLTILKDPVAAAERADSLLFAVTRWDPDSLNALLARFGNVTEDLAHLETLSRIYEAYAQVKKLGIPASALIQAATNEPSADTVRALQAALRARFDESDWLAVLKPINDEMRTLQRNALVTYILHQMRDREETEHIDTPEKLFEYFLMDVLMGPCMQTSRIRHALSSIQLFIDRCLMNLEQRVAPGAINAKHWVWMKRYRVWEANRKVFLWPENWLEPELRDDQSPFFKETMSELLQSDITEDRAAVALGNYLAKLEEVAKLEPCGTYYEEGQPGTDDDVVHVVARTAGAKRKYYYRRRAPSGWTPWEQISLDIEDNPVMPIVWKGRLFLFWLRILKKAHNPGKPPVREEAAGKGLANLDVSDIEIEVPQVPVQAILCWSEHFNGKWLPTNTSDVNRPVTLGQYSALDVKFGRQTEPFERALLRLHAVVGDDLRILVYYHEDQHLRDPFDHLRGTFVLYNSHSLPITYHGEESSESRDAISSHGTEMRVKLASLPRLEDTSHELDVDYISNWNPDRSMREQAFSRRVLSNELPGHVVESTNVASRWHVPFFYADSHHVFYITSDERRVKISDSNGYVIPFNPGFSLGLIPHLVFKEDPRTWAEPREDPPVTIRRDPSWIDPSPIERFISEDAYVITAIATTGTVSYGDRQIGPAGGLTDDTDDLSR